MMVLGNTVPLRRIADMHNGGTPTADAANWGGAIPWATPRDLGRVHGGYLDSTERTITEVGSSHGAPVVPPGSVILSTRAPVGYIAIATERMAFNQGCRALVPHASTVSSQYLSYALQSSTEKLEAAAQGTTFLELSSTSLANIRVPFVPHERQQLIVDFLDRETAEIDAFIADQERLIELLEERRAATITQVVTKGLDPNAPMKDSGVEWLGEVPRHWGIRKLKSFVATPITDGPHETPELLSEGIPFVSAEAVSSGVLNFKNIRGYISIEDHRRFSRKYSPRRGDIYMIKSGATTGRCAIVETDADFSIWSPLAAIRCGDTASPRFVLHALRSANFQESVRLFWNYGTQQNIGMKVLENLPIPFPDMAEQQEIADYLDAQTSKIDSAIGDAREAIVLSQERRAALISAAVTGQLDVSQTQPPVDEVLEQGVQV